MFKRYIYACIVAASILLTYSCKEDIGNYDYEEINEVKFSDDLDEKITGYMLKQLLVKPELLFTKDAGTDPNRYNYAWTYLIGSGQENSGMQTLATTKDLDITVNLAPGTYEAFYKVKDTHTGVEFVKRFSLEIRNEYSEGWLLMTEVAGKAQLGFVSKQPNGEYLTISNLLGAAGSNLQLKGKPHFVYTYNTGRLNGYGINLPYGVYVGTDQSTDRVNPETFAWQEKYNVKNEILNPDLPADFHLDIVKQARGSLSGNAYMISSEGNVYFMASANQVKYSQPFNYDGTSEYRISRYCAINENFVTGNPPAYFYDMDNRRFRKHYSPFDARLLAIPDPEGTAPQFFSFTNTGKDLLYMDFVAKGAEIYALLKDPATTKVHLARFAATDATQLDYVEMLATDIDKAEHVAISPVQGYIYYSVGSKLYQYDYSTSPTTCKVVKDYGAAKISALKFQVYHNEVKYKDGDKLVVCTHEGDNGKMDHYSVLLGAAGIELDKSFTGFGKVVSLHYRER